MLQSVRKFHKSKTQALRPCQRLAASTSTCRAIPHQPSLVVSFPVDESLVPILCPAWDSQSTKQHSEVDLSVCAVWFFAGITDLRDRQQNVADRPRQVDPQVLLWFAGKEEGDESGPHLSLVPHCSSFHKCSVISGNWHFVQTRDFASSQSVVAVHDIHAIWGVDGVSEWTIEEPGIDSRLHGLHRFKVFHVPGVVVGIVRDELQDELGVEVFFVWHGVACMIETPHGECSQPSWLPLQCEGRCVYVLVLHSLPEESNPKLRKLWRERHTHTSTNRWVRQSEVWENLCWKWTKCLIKDHQGFWKSSHPEFHTLTREIDRNSKMIMMCCKVQNIFINIYTLSPYEVPKRWGSSTISVLLLCPGGVWNTCQRFWNTVPDIIGAKSTAIQGHAWFESQQPTMWQFPWRGIFWM